MNSRQKKELNRHKNRSEIARQADLEVMASSPTPKTWSATMPAYCYTERDRQAGRSGGDGKQPHAQDLERHDAGILLYGALPVSGAEDGAQKEIEFGSWSW